MWPFRRSVPLEKQLARLGELGFVLRPDVEESDLTSFFASRAEMERKPFVELIEVVGCEVQREPFTPICDRFWMCDFERIEDDDSYVHDLQRLELLSGAALGVRNAVSRFDFEARRASIEFESRGGRMRWELAVDNDWIDPTFFERYDAELARRRSPVRIHQDSRDYGQSVLFGGFTREQHAAIEKLSRRRWRALNP